MSAQSGGIEWSSVIKPLLTNHYGNLNKNEIKNIIKAIQKIEPELFEDENDYQQFYTAFAALAADKLCHCKSVCQSLVASLQEVCAILIRYILFRLTKVSVYEVKWLLPALKSLCGENPSGLPNKTNASATLASSTSGTSSGTNSSTSIDSTASTFDYNVVANVLRSTQYPDSSKSASGEKESPKSDVKRSRSDLSAIIFQQITSPLEVGKIKFSTMGDEVADCTEVLASANKAYFQSLDGAEILLKVCMNLPHLSRYRTKYLDPVFASTSNKSLYLPLTQAEAQQIRNNLVNIATDVSILHQALSFWAVQKLTPARITILSKCAISALYCGILASIATSVLNMSSSGSSQKSQQSAASSGVSSQNAKEPDEHEESAHMIVDKSLEVYTMVGTVFKISARSHIYHNHLCFGAWLLVTGIQGAMGASGSNSSGSSSGSSKSSEESASKPKSKTDTPAVVTNNTTSGSNLSSSATVGIAGATGGSSTSATARVNLFKVQQGFGVLNAAIGNHCIKLLSELLDDLRIESTCNAYEDFDSQQLPKPANFDILENYSSLQRVIRVLNAATLHQLFTFLATVSYRKACSLKRVNTKDRTDNNDPISYSDSTTYFNDTMSCSDTSEEDDSESFLGHWFKETISPEGNEVDSSSQPQERNPEIQGPRLVPTLDEPHEYLDLAAQIFCFLEQFFASHHYYLNRYVGAGLSDQQMLLLANILKDLDRDAARIDIENNICAKWQTSMIRFSGAVGRYLHNLISAGLLSEQLQSSLLQYLSVSPWATDINTWPLQVYPNTLSVLVQILLLKPTQEKEAACLSIWHRLINTLVEGVCTMVCATDVDYEDLNVEHAQLLLFLFHSLNLMQKKSILLLTAGAVVRCSEVCRGLNAERPMRNSQVMLLSRLLLLLEYLMKNLYNAPPELLDQVRWNLFSISTLQESQRISDIINNKTKMSSFYRKDIEDKFRKAYAEFFSNIRPTFYCLSPSDTTTSIAMNIEFKLDGLAWNFILCSPDKLKYPLLVDALMDILRVIDMSTLRKSSMYSLCAVQYCFSFCWKLLLGLPSSNAHIEAFDTDNSPNLSSLLWAIRFLMPTSRYLIVNSLIKQGIFTQGAEALWDKISTRVSDIRFALKQTQFGVSQFNKTVDKDNVLLSQIILLDATLGYMRSIAWAEKKGIKPLKATTSNPSSALGTSVPASSVGGPGASSSSSSVTNESGNSTTISMSSISHMNFINKLLQPDIKEQPTEEESSVDESSVSTTSTGTSATTTTPISTNSSSQSATEQTIKQTPPIQDYVVESDSLTSLKAKTEASNNLLITLIENARIISNVIKRKMNAQLSDENPEHVLDLTLSFAGRKHAVTAELHLTFLKLLPTPDLEVISIDWSKCLYVSEEIFNTDRYPVEDFTLLIIDSHVTELTAFPHYSTLYSLKHCFKNLLYLINLVLPLTDCTKTRNELRHELVSYLLDARFEYVYEITEECLQNLFADEASASTTNNASNESMLLLIYEYVVRHYYKLLIDFAEELRSGELSQSRAEFNTEMLFAVIDCLPELLDKPEGVKAMYNFFKPNDNFDVSSTSSLGLDSVEYSGSLVELILSFTGTNMSISYAKKMLQFVEKLFQIAEKENTLFPMDDLIQCFNDLANVDTGRLKSWLSHVIYGPNGSALLAGSDTVDKVITSVQPSSTPSSNAQTPTNMATVSALPSISDQFAHSFALDAEAIDIDDEGAVTAATGGSSAAIALPNSALVHSLYLWTYAGNNGSSQNNGGNSCNTNQSEDTSQEDAPAPPQQIPQNERNGALLLTVVKYIVKNKHSSISVVTVLFQSLLQLSQSLLAPRQAVPDFSDILQVMIVLADTQQGRGHAVLFSANILWLEITKYKILQRATSTDQLANVMPQTAMENITAFLSYLNEILQSLGFHGGKSIQPTWDDDAQIDLEELIEEFAPEEDEAFVDDSDEDSLNNKLCTFSQTQKEFMNQHWYHCHTCNMVNTVGVCSICARVCHKGHDVSYAKYGNFFCDCGAKEDGSCQALSRRVSSTGTETRTVQNDFSSGYISSNISSISSKRRALTPPKQIQSSTNPSSSTNPNRSENTSERVQFLTKLLENCRESLLSAEQWSVIVRCILGFFDILFPYVKENCFNYSIVGCQKRAKNALDKLHKGEVTFQTSEDLMIATLGSQEGAFENVRMNYSGDQGNTIKQLLSSGLVRRVALCCLSSIHGKRQHLAVSLEKGKVTILQLSALLKQADAAKRKLTLTQLASAPIPCPILSLAPNPANEDCLAVCGLKECHILTFSNTGAVNDHIVITPQVENGNFIKKAIWLPGSQTLLALATADYVKIYDLSEDSYSPKYYFLVALGKIRDCCFVYQNGTYYLLLFGSSGYIYYESLNHYSLAKHGDFYITNTLQLNHPQIKDVNGQLCAGGVSLYYSHTLQMLFFSFISGKNFMASLTNVNTGVKNITCLQIGPSAKSSSKGPAQPLIQWMEIAGHPGLVCAMMHTSNNPVILMVTPEQVFVQEIKAQSQKARIMDMVAIRHSVSGVEKTSLILLCEDGSLRILTAHAENTGYWLTSNIQPIGNQLYSSTVQIKSTVKKSKRKAINTQKTVGPTGAPVFPIDFFEHCVVLNDIEFGGNDLLQIYNKQKLKTRLSSSGMFVASTKPTGFTLEIYNNDPNMCIVGVRVLLGNQDILRAPTTVSVYGRTVQTPVRRSRWFDIPFTRDEMLQSDKMVKVLFGKSQDPENVCMLDSIEVYGKSKDVIGWPDETEDSGNSCVPSSSLGTCAVGSNTNASSGGSAGTDGYYAVTNLDKLITNLLEVMDCSLNLLGGTGTISADMRTRATKMATNLLLLPTPNQVQMQARYVLATLFNNRTAYHHHKDSEVLAYVDHELQDMKSLTFTLDELLDIDPEAFYRLVLLVRSIANARPQSLEKICTENRYDIVTDMICLMKLLHSITPVLDEPVSIVRRGLSHTETIVHSLVDIMYAFALSDLNNVEKMTKYLINLLNNPSDIISHSAKDALILLLNPRLKRRKVAIVTPPACSTPTPSNTMTTATGGLSSSAMDVDGTASRAASDILGAASSASVASIGAAAVIAEAVAQSNDSDFVDPTNGDPLHEASQLLNLESLMGGFPQLLGLPHDADDEAIMDIAIALSLQQHDGESLQTLQQSLANLRNAVNLHNFQALEGNGLGIAPTAASVSAGGSDDEGSNVATEGSTLRTSPAEPVGSGGSESGGSGVESIGGISGRSSTYGDPANSSPPRSATTVPSNMDLTSKTSSTGICCSEQCRTTSGVGTLTSIASSEQDENDTEDEKLIKLHDLRVAILENIVLNIKSLDDCNGIQAVPLIQVILLLTTDLNGNSEKDQKILNDLLTALINYTEIGDLKIAAQMKDKNDKNEVRLVILSLFGVLMGKTKSKQAGTTSPPHQFKDNASFVASTAASVLNIHDAFSFSRVVMESLLPHWVQVSSEQSANSLSTTCGGSSGGSGGSASTNAGTVVTSGTNSITPNQNQLLKPTRYGPKPDIAAIIPYNYLKNYPDVFESYDTILTEVSVRLPYQILRLSAIHPGTYDWYHSYCEKMTYTLCEYMMLNLNALLRRQVRKLLMYICGNKEKFRMYRDGHSLGVHFNTIKEICKLHTTKNTVLYNQTIPVLTYDQLVDLTENLRTCQEISQIRTGNWQKFCLIHDDVIPVLIEIACYQLDDGVSPIILQLLQAALCNNVLAVKQQQQQTQQQQQQQQQQPQPSTSAKSRSEREKSEDTEISYDSKFDSAHCSTFVHQISRYVSDQLLNKFIRIFLLETNITSIRWQAHSLIYAIFEHSNEKQKEKLISVLWNMWPLVPVFGRRTAQFVDILGFLTLSTKSIESKLPEYTEKAVEVLRQQNDLLAKHPNGPIYTILEQILQVSGYYLESEPCLVCNNPEVPFTNIKLHSIKSDIKFTTTTMIVKLVQCHTISKLIVRIADLKRNKMVRTINIYYNNRTVQAVVELKNRPSLWHKARSVTIQSGQTEVKIDFPLPITACNLMVEYADFYETVTGSSENLQCPRCSAAVPAYPGVCGNCGENVFQCHKCRAINYDEKDPFLCHSCGFCKYAKFDFSIYGRVCCAVDPIELAEDRAKTVLIIHSSLDRADRIYRQLQTNKQMLELLIQRVCDSRGPDRIVDDNMGTVHGSSQVNKIIQVLAQKYCVESKASFEELSKIVQKVKACRGELVAYDRSQQNLPNNTNELEGRIGFITNRCYGCALASTEQCLTLLRAMASNYECRLDLYSQGLVTELAEHNLRRGTPQIQDEVRNLLVLLTKQNEVACLSLLDLISERVRTAVLGAIPLTNLDSIIHHEMILLEALIAQDDFCWEDKLRVVFDLFLVACSSPHCPSTSVIQPCLRIMQALIGPMLPATKTNFTLTASDLPPLSNVDGLTINFNKWLRGHPHHTYAAWRGRVPVPTAASEIDNVNTPDLGFINQSNFRTYAALMEMAGGNGSQQLLPPPSSPSTSEFMKADGGTPLSREEIRANYLMEKYGRRWQLKIINRDRLIEPLILNANWLQPILFNTNSRFGRQLACSLLTSLARTHERKREILNLLTSFLCYVGDAGEASSDFLSLYRCLATDTPWHQYLVLKGVLTDISQLLSAEIAKIHRLEETTLSSDLSLGYALRQFVELLSMFLESASVRQVYKTRLLGTVLEGYLSLRKLVVQRTRLIDDAQEKLLEMLEEMTSGTEEETRAFMEILIDTVEKTSMNDIKTPVFIFERLYSIIHPEENDESEFFMALEKDPQQEDFLQGRMLGNPYPSNEPGLGPLMRNIKNKICTDCELIALLDDDNGMELLVNNKIISLDLAVKDVYKKIWIAEGGERDAMRIVYRMRGLLGDATEEFVETLNNKSQEEVDTEQLYRMANVLADCKGLKVMLDRIGSLQSYTRTRELMQVLLKLFLICVKVKKCQEVLCQPELGAINTLLKVLQICLENSIQSPVTEQLLEIMETILSKAASDSLNSFLKFSLTFGGPEYITSLISCTDCSNVRTSPSVLRHLIRVLAALVYGNDLKMSLLCQHFMDVLDFARFDLERTPEEEFKMELFCVLTNQIEHNCIGGTLKDHIVGLGIVEKAINYITKYAPCVKPTLLRTDSDELKEFISRPSLKYILRFLTGLANKHEATQVAISKDIIPIIHRLEQVSSDEHVGSLAENLLEALCTDPATAARVQEVRDFTRAEKKRLAMATREKQLDALGMRTNEKGQVTAKGAILQKMEKLREETGLACFICREGYSCQPAKVLGIYTFTKRCNVEDFELKTRKTAGYTTVTHFNIVHVDCHTSAIRSARGRDEWERASLQNANTRCNGLLPLWGPDVSETSFSACMSRHTSYMAESTQRCDISFTSSIHDLKLLLMRFAWERSFHDDAGGGGPQSNMHFIPYLLFYAVYLQLSLRSAARDTKTLMAYLSVPPSEKWLESGYEVDGPLYMITISLALHSPEQWNRHKLTHLRRLIAIAQARYVSPYVLCKALLAVPDRQVKDYSIYKPYFMMFGLVDMIYNCLFKSLFNPKEEEWSVSLFDYIRKNDEAMLKATDEMLQTFTESFLPCTSFSEFCDVAGLLHLITEPDNYIQEVLASLPTSVSPAAAATTS